jgi:hypothetical protein
MNKLNSDEEVMAALRAAADEMQRRVAKHVGNTEEG